jgi:hypothetical protein
MKKVIKKLLLGDKDKGPQVATGAITKRIQNIKVIWNNDHHDDIGIEKLFRLFLAASQFLFPGIYIKHFFGKKGNDIQDLAMDGYVLFKVFFPLSLLYFNWFHGPIAMAIVLCGVTETLLYVPTLIFASDFLTKPSSYRRSMLMLFLNYFEITFAFAYIYSRGNYLNIPFEHWYDPIYFSITTLGTIGYGEYHPVTGMGKFLVCTQSIIFLSFVVLFINFFSNKIQSKGGYFGGENMN